MKTIHKYLEKGENDHPALGNFVNWFLAEKHLKKKDIADKLGIHPSTLQQYLKQQSVQFGIMWRLSQAMNYNLIMDLAERLNIDFETKTEKQLRAELAEKEDLIKTMEIQLGLYEKLMKR
jgi:transcriptional regulator with XRE-family HTH domain